MHLAFYTQFQEVGNTTVIILQMKKEVNCLRSLSSERQCNIEELVIQLPTTKIVPHLIRLIYAISGMVCVCVHMIAENESVGDSEEKIPIVVK